MTKLLTTTAMLGALTVPAAAQEVQTMVLDLPQAACVSRGDANATNYYWLKSNPFFHKVMANHAKDCSWLQAGTKYTVLATKKEGWMIYSCLRDDDNKACLWLGQDERQAKPIGVAFGPNSKPVGQTAQAPQQQKEDLNSDENVLAQNVALVDMAKNACGWTIKPDYALVVETVKNTPRGMAWRMVFAKQIALRDGGIAKFCKDFRNDELARFLDK